MINIKVASYALVDILKAIESNGVSSCTITKEDGTLEIVLTKKDLYPFFRSQSAENFSK